MQKTFWRRLLTAGLILIACVYALALVKIVLLKYGWTNELRGLQLLPFHFVQDLIQPMTSLGVVLKNVLGNIAIFIPLGILLPALFRKLTFGKTVLIGFLTSLGFEVLQYIVGFGAADVDDLILNTLGCLAGAGLYYGLLFRGGKRPRARLAAFIVLVVFGCCGLLSLWLFEPRLLPRQIEYENAALWGELDPESYDISGAFIGIEDGAVLLRPDSASDSAEAPSPETRYALTADTRIILEHHSYQYSPNGNIQKTFVAYELATPESAAAAFESSEAGFCDIWLDGEGACQTLALTLFEAEE